MKVALILLLFATPAVAQEISSSAANPLASLNEQLKQVLAAAQRPFTPGQERAIALMMEERRRASEDLFGDLMDFSAGPTRGQDEDRLRSAIDWMRGEFLRLLANYLTPEQAAIWQEFQSPGFGVADGAEQLVAQALTETQYVRINSNRFTAEDRNFEGSDSEATEVIQRGGIGAWHGNAQLLLKDDALNARNALAANEPPYQERRLSVDVSGPALPGRLTSSIAFEQNESKNVDTVRATLPEGIFALGITRPDVFRELSSRNTLQLANVHSLRFFFRYGTESSTNQGVGGFTLPERASDTHWRRVTGEIKQFSALSSQSIFESRLQVNDTREESSPHSDAVRINVLGAFNGGGAQNRSDESQRVYQFNTLYTRLREKLTLKSGVEGSYRRNRSLSTTNFGGTFTFSSLDDYVAGTPLNFRVSRGTPLLAISQFQVSSFLQSDLNLTRQVTLMVGARYDVQTNLPDHNNVSPRVAVAYSPGQATVIRGGGGIFYNLIGIGMFENHRRFDGMRQFEIVIGQPSYPDPFAAAPLVQTPPSIRVTDPNLRAPYITVGMVSVERTILSNLLLTATYDYQREFHRLRVRDLNAPFDTTAPVPRACVFDQPADTCVRPDPARGNIINFESTGNEVRHNLRFSVRKRFSIFNVSGNYQLQRALGDVQGSPGTAATNSSDLRADWGRAPFPRHTVTSSVNARLPLGVFLTGTMAGNSGRYYTITTGQDDNRDSNITDRPAGVPPNSARGPRYLNFDFNLSKAFFFRRAGGGGNTGTNMNVFANMTNAFNHVHYATPSGVLTSPTFGRPTSAQYPREIEVGVRFQF